MGHSVYLQLYPSIEAERGQKLILKDIARLEGEEKALQPLLTLPVYRIQKEDKSHVIIDILTVLRTIHFYDPDIHVEIVGPLESVIEITANKKVLHPVLLLLVWLLLFIGAALAIMNFHEDVSMLAVHQKLFHLITGKEAEQPLLLQIPYSIGLGLGMILFFNHVFKKRINEEPSPLEVEMFNYKQDLERYLAETERDRSSKPWRSKLKPY